MKKKKLTSLDIAKELGISRSVVSFVLNGKSKEMRISDELTKKVLDFVEESNYQPNYMAQSLRTGKSNTIGLVVADISNPFFSKMARQVEIEIERTGYNVIFCSSEENEKQFHSQIENLKNRQVDGLLLVPPINSISTLQDLTKEKLPFVIVDRVFEKLDVNSVIINNHKAAFEATMRLIKNGRKNIALINVNNELTTMNDRTKGYIDAIQTSGSEVNQLLVKQLKFSNIEKDVREAIIEVVRNKADAILFTTNKLGITGIQTIHNMNIKVPEDIVIVSFDDTSAYAVAKTPITAIKQPIDTMIKEAVRILFKLIDAKETNIKTEKIVLDTRLIIRESCP